MTRLSDDELASRAARMAAIRACWCCDPSGWRLGLDGAPIDPAVRCGHGTPPPPSPPCRDVSEPIHEPPAVRAP